MKEKLEALKNNDGLTLKAYKAITYKSGYQVADYGTECKTIAEALKLLTRWKEIAGSGTVMESITSITAIASTRKSKLWRTAKSTIRFPF